METHPAESETIPNPPGQREELAIEARDAIEAELGSLKTTIDSLNSQRTAGEDKLHREAARARELTSQIVAARRDEDKAMLASDEAVSHALKDQKEAELQAIEKLLDKPYFARVVLEEETPTGTKAIEYKLGFAANVDCRIIDWRKAPISKLYYDYKEGDYYSETIQGRERDGKVALRNTVEIERGELRKLSCRHGSFTRTPEGWRGAAAGRTRAAGGLKEILALITSEQFEMITTAARTAILIQGIAGSGKTTVALHRLAWLLHEDNSPLQPGDCVVIALSRTLQSYIATTLPSLGVHGVTIVTFHDLMAHTLRRAAPWALGDSGDFRRPSEPAPHGIDRVMRSMALLKTIDQRLKGRSALASATLGPTEIARALDEALAETEAIVRLDETKLLTLDLVKNARARFARNLADGVLDRCAEAPLVRIFELITGGLIRPDGRHGKLGHIVVDEVQDYGPLELACLIGGVSKLDQLTLVGDTAQGLSGAESFPGWEKLRHYWSLGEEMSRYVSLTISHRSTLPIMRLGDYVQGRTTVTDGRAGRAPIWFVCPDESIGIKAAIDWLNRAIERYPTSLTAVVCADPDEAREVLSFLKPTFGELARPGDRDTFSFQEGIIVTDVKESKGLEFVNVLIWNPTAKNYPSDQRGRNALYIALTRAEENLCVVTWARPSPNLPPSSSPLMRFVDMTPPEEPED
jgi:DNA helicase-2/ATP-dependent DNA helicase PcrA